MTKAPKIASPKPEDTKPAVKKMAQPSIPAEFNKPAVKKNARPKPSC